MSYYQKLIGDKCYLSPITEADGENWSRWLNDCSVALPLGDEVFQVLSQKKTDDMVAGFQSDMATMFTIVDKETDKGIGRIMLFGTNQICGSSTLGVFIGEKDYWSNGYGTEAIRLILDFGFNLLNLHAISLGVFAFNKRAISCYKKVGFKEVGRRREARPVGNKYYDAVLMDILSTEYESVYVQKLLEEFVE